MSEKRTDPQSIDEYASLSKDDIYELYKIKKEKLENLENAVRMNSRKYGENQYFLSNEFVIRNDPDADFDILDLFEAIKNSEIRNKVK
jgi:nanoRNase/pAp phosphatase (c-di-AMP/oligoRNAs hydrolase)